MEYYLTHLLPIHLIIFQAIILWIILSNAWVLQHSRQQLFSPPSFPSVSILVPARNEAKNIAPCVHSLLAQDYPDFEVLVLDDQSNDATPDILQQIAQTTSRLHVLTGSDLPENSLGKSWACVQLAEKAQGELLFFTDADTVHHPGMLRTAVTALIKERADLLTGFPHQVVLTWGERLIVPFFAWAFYSFTPLVLAYRLRWPALSNAVGQMLLFRRQAYQAIGGHHSVHANIVEDLTLARRIKSAGLRWRVIEAADLISCRMYTSSREAVDGLSKNLFAAFDFRLLPYLFIFTWLMVMFWAPLVVVGLHSLGLAPDAQIPTLAVCISISILLWVIPYRRLGFSIALGLLYPVTILVNFMVGLRSLRLSLAGRLTWKGRQITRPKWKWL